MLRTAARRVRRGFTLVELMVAAAICVLIMAVLATAFQLGIDTMRQMKSAGEMMDQLRGATTALQADLQAPHLLDTNGQPKKLSSYRWDQVQVTDNGAMANPRYTVTGWKAPDYGFVRIRSGPLAYKAINGDPDGLINGAGIATGHYLHFTSILSGLSDDDYYAGTTPAGGATYRSTAAELAYFLDPTSIGTTPGGTPLFRLIRRQRLAALNDTDRRDRPWPGTPPAAAGADDRHAVFSFRQQAAAGPYFLSTLGELTSPFNRLGGTRWSGGVQSGPAYAPMATATPSPFDDALAPMQSPSRAGEDTLLSNVISFEVQVIYVAAGGSGLPTVGNPRLFTPGTNTDTPFDVLPNAPASGNNIPGLSGTATYDSWNQGMSGWTQNVNQSTQTVIPDPRVPPLLIRVQAVQVRIRMWDPKLQSGRQVTIVQDL